MPVTTPRIKVDAVAARGAEVVLHGDSYAEAYKKALSIRRSRGLTYVHPFDDPEVIAGQGTIGMEILRQHPAAIDAIFVPVGGGGLISGIAAYVKSVNPQVRIVGVEPVDSDAMRPRCKAGQAHQARPRRPVRRRRGGEGGRARDLPPVPRSWSTRWSSSTPTRCAPRSRMCSRRRAWCSSRRARSRSPAPRPGWKSTAPKDKTLVAVASGANINFDRLRFVAEEAELGEHREAVLAVTIPERPGSFRDVLPAARRAQRHRVQLPHRRGGARRTSSSASRCRAARRRARIVRSLRRHGLTTLDLSDNEMAKLHTRHMVGGRAPFARNRIALPLRVPRAPRRADALPRQHAQRLEHQPVPLPQPGRRLRPRAGGHAGAARANSASSGGSCGSSATPTPTRRATPPTSCSCSRSCRRSSARRRSTPAKRARPTP